VSVEPAALLTFSIGPVHSFIGQARRIADLWAGSAILSEVTGAAMDVLNTNAGAALIFPARLATGELPPGLPNRFVARVPEARASEIAREMERAVERRWTEIVDGAVTVLGRVGIDAGEEREKENAPWRDSLTTTWSWVREDGDYVRASNEGASLFGATRVYRPFRQLAEAGTKCAICGERNALPNGKPDDVRAAWDNARKAPDKTLEKYFRTDQGRLCLVCAAKRLYPESGDAVAKTKFKSFEDFQPDDNRPYFAVVTMDGDHLGDLLQGKPGMEGPALEAYQQRISRVLSSFAEKLRTDTANLNLTELVRTGGLELPLKSAAPKHPPQLIYAGGEDVLFVADPRDALPVASAIQGLYSRMFAANDLSSKDFTISAAIVFAHTSVPAGVLFNDAERLLKEKAKNEAKRNSVAVSMHKRSGHPVDVVFRWNEDWVQRVADICDALQNRRLASGQTYDLAEADQILRDVFEKDDQWNAWLRYRLGQGEFSSAHADDLVSLLQPFFVNKKTDALRIARFIAVEAAPREKSAAKGNA
jgi:CRISPR/Cas system-associated protein Cas10 (large subunit of type III CRISPR-Cas system)